MAHKFDPRKIEKLEDPSRLKLFDPEKTLRTLGLQTGMIVLDVGTGTGFYLPFLSKLTGPAGMIYAIDIQEKMLEIAQKRIHRENLQNVRLIQSEENRIPLPDKIADFVFMAFTFHELEAPSTFLGELKRVAKPSGLLAIVDWKKKKRDKGPPPEEVFSEREIVDFLTESGLAVEGIIDLGFYCFAIKARFPQSHAHKNNS